MKKFVLSTVVSLSVISSTSFISQSSAASVREHEVVKISGFIKEMSGDQNALCEKLNMLSRQSQRYLSHISELVRRKQKDVNSIDKEIYDAIKQSSSLQECIDNFG